MSLEAFYQPAVHFESPGTYGRPEGLFAVLAAVREGRRFLVSAHARPDGDAIGSMLAMGSILQQMGKEATLVSCDGLPLIYHCLPCSRTILRQSEIVGDYDTVILLECDGVARSRLRGLEGRKLINIDHHISGQKFGDVNWIEPEACAVAELVYELALEARVVVTPEMATCLYAAVLTDTGSFCYDGTDSHTFELAASLVRHGARPAVIAEQVYFSNPTSKMMLLGAALNNLRRDGKLAWLSVTQDDMLRARAAEEDCEGVVNYAIGIAGVETAVFLRELKDRRVRLSLRSKGRVDVARLAEEFGGGGHAHAAGCTLEGPMYMATNVVLERLRAMLRESMYGLG
jgi:phosphoesterase RecJ-like protein